MTHISYTQADQQFLADVNAYIERYISKQVITLAMIADSLQMSHAAIRYKIRLLTGLSGSDYILKVRLQHSLHQMIHEHRNVSEAANESGFKDLSYNVTVVTAGSSRSGAARNSPSRLRKGC